MHHKMSQIFYHFLPRKEVGPPYSSTVWIAGMQLRDITIFQVSIGYTTRLRLLRYLSTEGRRPKVDKYHSNHTELYNQLLPCHSNYVNM